MEGITGFFQDLFRRPHLGCKILLVRGQGKTFFILDQI